MSETLSYDDLLMPPDDATVERAVRDYVRLVREAYGDRVKGVFLFGSRARGDHTPDSDADVAIVLVDDGWEFWREKSRLTDLTYDFLIESGVDIQAWPIRESEWLDPGRHHNPRLVKAMRQDSRQLS